MKNAREMFDKITLNQKIKKLQEIAKKENRSASNFIEYLIEKKNGKRVSKICVNT